MLEHTLKNIKKKTFFVLTANTTPEITYHASDTIHARICQYAQQRPMIQLTFGDVTDDIKTVDVRMSDFMLRIQDQFEDEMTEEENQIKLIIRTCKFMCTMNRQITFRDFLKENNVTHHWSDKISVSVKLSMVQKDEFEKAMEVPQKEMLQIKYEYTNTRTLCTYDPGTYLVQYEAYLSKPGDLNMIAEIVKCEPFGRHTKLRPTYILNEDKVLTELKYNTWCPADTDAVDELLAQLDREAQEKDEEEESVGEIRRYLDAQHVLQDIEGIEYNDEDEKAAELSFVLTFICCVV